MGNKIIIFLYLSVLLFSSNTANAENLKEEIPKNYYKFDFDRDGIMDSVLCTDYIKLWKRWGQEIRLGGGDGPKFYMSKSKIEEYYKQTNEYPYTSISCQIIRDEQYSEFKKLLLALDLPDADVKNIPEILEIAVSFDDCNSKEMYIDYQKYALQIEEIINQVLDGYHRECILSCLSEPLGDVHLFHLDKILNGFENSYVRLIINESSKEKESLLDFFNKSEEEFIKDSINYYTSLEKFYKADFGIIKHLIRYWSNSESCQWLFGFDENYNTQATYFEFNYSSTLRLKKVSAIILTFNYIFNKDTSTITLIKDLKNADIQSWYLILDRYIIDKNDKDYNELLTIYNNNFQVSN